MKDDPILVTGATGFLGGFLAGELIARGRRTVLLAGRRGDPRTRMERLLDYLGVIPRHPPVIMGADLTRPGLGLEREQLKTLAGVPEVLHCAAMTSFSGGSSEKVRSVNLDGTLNLLEAVKGCRRFDHMSTAYAAGRMRETVMEEPVTCGEFNNPYEQSKKLAEDALASRCEDRGIELAVFRPSITYGDSRTGMSIRFNALYYPVRVLVFLRDTMRKDILQNNGKRAASMGASLDENGSVRLPVSLPGDGELNLIPVDFLVKAVLSVMEKDGTGIFHVVNPRHNTIRELVSYTREFYGITGVEVSEEPVENGVLQSLVNRYMKVYFPYFTDRRRFDRSRLEELIGRDSKCPEMNAAVFRRCMDYAIEADWGGRIVI